jgi:hypothetical protein
MNGVFKIISFQATVEKSNLVYIIDITKNLINIPSNNLHVFQTLPGSFHRSIVFDKTFFYSEGLLTLTPTTD